MKKTLLIIASIMVLAALFYSYVSSPSPLLLTNAKIYRAGGISDSATALLVEEGRISFIGNDREAASLAPGGAEIIDLQGKLVLPGFIDSHVHPLFGAMMDAACPLQAVENAEDLRQALNKCQSEQPRELLIGFGINQSVVPFQRSIFGSDFDNQAVLLIAYDVHTGFLNHAGLALLGITADTPSPDDGLVEKDATTGEPTGLLLDGGLHTAFEAMPNPGIMSSIGMLRDWIHSANQLGYTTLLDAGSAPDTARLSQVLESLGLLDVRMHSAYVVTPTRPGVEQVQAFVSEGALRHSGSTAGNTIKVLIDGVIESNTGALEPGYGIEGEPPAPYFSPEQLNAIVIEADKSGFMMHMHATGDRAVNMAIDAVEAARHVNGDSGLVHTVAHAELIAPRAIERLAPLNMALNTTPIWIAPPDETIETYSTYIGEERIEWLQPLRAILDANIALTSGSDYPVTSNKPFLAIETAVTRKDATGNSNRVFQPGQRISVTEAIDTFTRHGARQLMQDDFIGSLDVGKAADLIVLDQNLLEIPAEDISETRVDLTVMGGRVVYQRP